MVNDCRMMNCFFFFFYFNAFDFAQEYFLIATVGIIIDLFDVLWMLSWYFLLQDMHKF